MLGITVSSRLATHLVSTHTTGSQRCTQRVVAVKASNDGKPGGDSPMISEDLIARLKSAEEEARLANHNLYISTTRDAVSRYAFTRMLVA
jgi:hypothetical protein